MCMSLYDVAKCAMSLWKIPCGSISGKMYLTNHIINNDIDSNNSNNNNKNNYIDNDKNNNDDIDNDKDNMYLY